MSCSKYNAGMLNEVVDIQRATRTSDGAGGFTTVWGTLAGSPTRASVKALSGAERFASERVEATSKWRVVVRYFDGLLESDLIAIRGLAYNIRFINNMDLADRWLVIDLDGGKAIP
jgi:SPP1 family predicted phage head-tail adaptor